MTLSAQELYRRGRAELNAGRNAAARRVLGQAAERTSDPDLSARIIGSLASLLTRQGDARRATQMCEDALARDGLSAQTAAMLRGQLGLLALERGDLNEAVSLLDRGIDGIGEEREHRTPMLINRSVAHMQRGDLDAARADLDRAAEDYAAAGDEVERAMAVHNAGYVALLAGDLAEAMQLMAQAREVMESASAVNTAICDLDRAEVLRDAGLTTEAEDALERVARVFGAHRMPQARGEAELHLARSRLAADPAGAARAATAAARRFRRIGSDAWAERAAGIRVRAQLARGVVTRTGDLAPVARGLPGPDETAAVASSLRRRGLIADARAVELAAQLRDTRQERRRPTTLPANAPIDLRLLAHRVRANRALADGREPLVRRHAAAGVHELSQWQEALGSLDLQSSVTMHGLPLMMAGLSSAMRSGRPDVLFEWSERARHYALRVVPVRPPRDPQVAADLAELRIIRAEGPDSDWLAGPRAAELHDRVRRRQWGETRAEGIEEHLTMDALQAALEPDTAVLAYVWSEGRMVCTAVTADSATVVELPEWPRAREAMRGLRSDLDMAASARTGPMAAVVQRSLDDRLAVLDRALVAPMLRATTAERFVITAPGVLGGIPWAMLPGLRDRVFTLPASATTWVSRRAEARRPTATVGFAVGPGVARGGEEARTAAAAWRGSAVLDGDSATVSAATELAGSVDLLHLAAHGRHAADNPMFAGLELADGALFGYDVDAITRPPRTVVLSACEVGRSAVRWGEEAVGMTRIWLHAGTRAVIAAPVAVADDEACELLGAMHQLLAAGHTPAEALAAAADTTGIRAPFACHGVGF